MNAKKSEFLSSEAILTLKIKILWEDHISYYDMCLANYGASEVVNLCSKYSGEIHQILGTKMHQFFRE